MKVFLIILAVIVVIFGFILSLSAEFTVVFDNGWSTKLRVLFFEWDIQLSRILSFVLFPEKAAEEKKAEKAEKKKEEADGEKAEENKEEVKEEKNEQPEKVEVKDVKKKQNYIQKILDQDGVVGLMLLISNLLQTASSAVTTLIKGLHIYSIYVKMIIGGGDAADIGQKFGSVCGVYYPIKGFVLNSMKVDMYDDYIQPDFIAPGSEYEFQIIASLNVALLLRVGLKAGKVFVVNLIKNK